jgi:sugar lactone lactonase YvrE
MTLDARVLDPTIFLLGEGPTWDAERGVAHWVDISRGQVFEGTFTSTGIEHRLLYQGEHSVGAAVHAEGGGYLVALASGLARLDEAGETVAEITIIPEGKLSLFNDGACDPTGRYLVGTIASDSRPGGEALYRLEHTGEVTVIDDDLTISNGLGWSPDGGILYSTDSGPGTIWARDYDPESGAIGRRRVFIDVDGMPDGMVVDGVGNLWLAIWGGAQMRCYSPAGELIEVVRTTASLTTSAAFVGPDLVTLLITSSSRSVPDAPETPDAGKLFTVEVPTPGRATTAWRPSF